MSATWLGILAQAAGPTPPADPNAGVVERFYAGELPGKADLVSDMTHLHEVWAFLLIVAGILYLLNGWKAYKVLVFANAAVLGLLVGSLLGGAVGDGSNIRTLMMIGGAVLLAVLSLPLIKGSVAVMGALAGGFAGYGLWSYGAAVAGSASLSQHAWAGALLGLTTLGLLAFLNSQIVVIAFTSIQGATMAVVGLLAILLRPYAPTDGLREPLLSNVHLLPVLLVVPAVMGFGLQYIAATKKAQKKKKAASAG